VDKNFIEIAKYNLAKANKTYESALTLLIEKDYNGSLNRAYYAVFHMICALLILDGKSYKEHSVVLAEFNKTYLKNKIFTEFSFKMLQMLSESRNNSDYTALFWASEGEAKEQLEAAKLICDAIEPYIRERIKSINIV